MCLAQLMGGADSLVHATGRHPDVGDDDVGPLGLDSGDQRVEVGADGGHLELRLRLEQAADALAHEVVVFRQHDPDRHLSEH